MFEHFVRAQEPIYPQVLAELRAGDKRSHWMWFIFPQLTALGRSPTALRYGLDDLGTAQEYLRHEVLGPRLLECTRAVLGVSGRTAHEIFGSPDDLKFSLVDDAVRPRRPRAAGVRRGARQVLWRHRGPADGEASPLASCSHHEAGLILAGRHRRRTHVLRHLTMAALGLAALLAPLPATAETSLAAYDAVREALVAVWDELQLSVRNATLVTGTPKGFGQYERRTGNSFKPDEAVTVYAELYGYGVTDKANGGYIRDLSADLALVDSTGAVRANQIGFWSSSETFETRPLEMNLSFSATLSAFPPGDYLLRFTVHDKSSDKAVSFDVPITLAAP